MIFPSGVIYAAHAICAARVRDLYHIATEQSEVISHGGVTAIYRICEANISLLSHNFFIKYTARKSFTISGIT